MVDALTRGNRADAETVFRSARAPLQRRLGRRIATFALAAVLVACGRGDESDPLALAEDLSNSDGTVRLQAAMRLEELREKAAPAVPALIWALDHPNRVEGINVADAMVSALGEIGPKAADAVPAIIRYLEARKTAWHGPRRALVALGKIHSRPDLSIPVLLQALDELKPERARTAHALARFGTAAAPAVPAIMRLLEAPDVPADYEIAAYLGVLRAAGPSARAAVPILARLLSHPEDVNVRVGAARALGAIGSDARDALPALESASRAESLRPPEDNASSFMREAITKIGGSPGTR